MTKFITLLISIFTPMLAMAQVANTPPSNEPDFNVSDNGPGLSRNGRIARYENWVYPTGIDVLAPWRVDRGFVKPSQIPGLLSNPYHKTGLAMNIFSGVPEGYTGHVPVYSEGNKWPFVGPQQILPNNQGVNRDLVQDAGLYFVNGEVVATQEPLFVEGDNRLKAKNETNFSYIITTGSFPGTEQPGQVMNILNPGQTITVPLAPEGWWPDAVVPETYSSVAGLNPLHIPGWHHSSWSPSEYPGGSQPRDFGTPGFAYNLDPNIDFRDGFTKNVLFAGLRTAEGYDPLISGEPGYGLAFYIDDELQAVINMSKTDDYNASATLVSQDRHNPANRQQGPITVASAIIAVQPTEAGEYRYITNQAAENLIAQFRNQSGWTVINETYDSNPQAIPLDAIVDPVLPGNNGATPGPAPTPSVTPIPTATPTPNTNETPNPINDSVVRREAENAVLLGDASVFSDSAASQMEAVGGTFGAGNGIQFDSVPSSERIRVQYASELSGQISVIVNGGSINKLNFNASGAWQGQYTSAEMNLMIPQNASVQFIFQDGDTAMNYDFVEFIGPQSASPTPVPQPTPTSTPGSSSGGKFDPGSNKTILLVGQNVWGEYNEYVQEFGAPAGGSHYGSIYSGTIRGGVGDDTDANAQFHLNTLNNSYSDSFSLVAINIKDNPGEGGFNSVTAALSAIANGQLDNQIDSFASTMNDQPSRNFVLRIGYEVSTSVFGSGNLYANAYNYIANRIRNTNGVDNVAFMYHPITVVNDVETLYPGDDFVDFVGFSVFNSVVCMPLPNQTFCSPGDEIWDEAQRAMDWVNNRGKALAIPESTARPPAVNSETDFQEYLRRLFNVVNNNDVKLISYISSNWPEQGWPSADWGDSRLTRFSGVTTAWRNETNNDRYVEYADLEATPTPAPIPTATATSVPAPTATPAPLPTATSTPEPLPTTTATAAPLPTATSTPEPAATATPNSSSNWSFIVHKPTGAKIHSCATDTPTVVRSRPNSRTGSCVQWQRVENGNFFHIQSRESGNFIKPDDTSNGSPISVVPNSWRGNWTQWSYQDRGDNHGHIINRATGKYIFLSATANSAISQQPSSWTGDFTRWRFVAAP